MPYFRLFRVFLKLAYLRFVCLFEYLMGCRRFVLHNFFVIQTWNGCIFVEDWIRDSYISMLFRLILLGLVAFSSKLELAILPFLLLFRLILFGIVAFSSKLKLDWWYSDSFCSEWLHLRRSYNWIGDIQINYFGMVEFLSNMELGILPFLCYSVTFCLE